MGLCLPREKHVCLSLPERLMVTEIIWYLEIRVGSLPISLCHGTKKEIRRGTMFEIIPVRSAGENPKPDLICMMGWLRDGTRRNIECVICCTWGNVLSFEELWWGRESRADLASLTKLDIPILRTLPSLYQLGVRYQWSPKWTNEWIERNVDIICETSRKNSETWNLSDLVEI